MARLLLAGMLLALSSASAHADDAPVVDDTQSILSVPLDSPEGTLSEALPEQSTVDESTESYQASSDVASRRIRARITYYVISGLMFSGEHTRPGAAACSWDLPLYTHLRLPDAREVTCLDRGLLGSGKPMSWIDIYAQNLAWGRLNVAQAYGNETMVEVLSR